MTFRIPPGRDARTVARVIKHLGRYHGLECSLSGTPRRD